MFIEEFCSGKQLPWTCKAKMKMVTVDNLAQKDTLLSYSLYCSQRSLLVKREGGLGSRLKKKKKKTDNPVVFFYSPQSAIQFWGLFISCRGHSVLICLFPQKVIIFYSFMNIKLKSLWLIPSNSMLSMGKSLRKVSCLTLNLQHLPNGVCSL